MSDIQQAVREKYGAIATAVWPPIARMIQQKPLMDRGRATPGPALLRSSNFSRVRNDRGRE